jgi:serine/threonine-protein kinase PknK
MSQPDPEVGGWIQRRYEVEAFVARGGLGHTFRVRDHLHDRPLALKLVQTSDAARGEALRLEFERLRNIAHPSLAQVHDLGRLGSDRTFFTADWIEGDDLATFARRVSEGELLRALIDALSALATLHAHGLRHGDFKPANVLVGARGGVLIDLSASAPFGAVREVSGTPEFLAPEILAGGPADGRADLYAVGVTLERLPIALPAAWRKLASRLRAREPTRRPSDVAEVLEALGAERSAMRARWPPSPLLEREGLVAEITRALDALRSGEARGRRLSMFGAPGTGRTRLLREAKWLAEPDLQVLEGRCDRPVVGWLARALGATLPPGLAGIFAALEGMRASGERWVLIVDDADLMNAADQAAFQALVQSLEPTDPVLAMWTTGDRPAADHLVVEPLSPSAVGAWAGHLLPPARREAFMRATEGRPALVARGLDALARGEIVEGEIAPARSLSARSRRALEALDPRGRAALARLVASAEALPSSVLGERATIESLVDAGLVRCKEAGWSLALRGETEAMAAWLGEDIAVAHAALADHFGELGSDDHVPQVVTHLARGARFEEALAIARQHQRDLRPGRWDRAVEALIAAASSANERVAAAELALLSGRGDLALTALATAIAAEPGRRRSAELARVVGEVLLERGHARRAGSSGP